ncbi:unnamed protein product [Lathyrus sativus]|nr:unnamed protein product [Lathyrus sativus]
MYFVGKYLLAVTNTYNITKIHINEDMRDIQDFLKRLPVDFKFGRSSTSGTQNRSWSQQSFASNLSLTEKFMAKAIHLPL